MLCDKVFDSTSRRGGVVACQLAVYLLDERVETREDPAVDLRTIRIGDLSNGRIEAVQVAIECEELIGVVERAEVFATHLLNPLRIEADVFPRIGIGDHVPA